MSFPSTQPRRTRAIRWRAEGGQGSVEIVALAPVIVGLCLLVAATFDSYKAHEYAGFAAHAAGVAATQGSDPKEAAVAAIPDVKKSRLSVKVSAHKIKVRVKARGPLAGVGFLAGTKTISVDTSDAN